jgi:hypothetical protein
MISHSTSIRTDHDDDELELPVEVVAERLGLPAEMLIRRIEAGDIPARRVDGVDGSHYHVRIADLGASTQAAIPEDEAGTQEIRGTADRVTRNGRGSRAAQLELGEDEAASNNFSADYAPAPATADTTLADDETAALDGIDLAPEEATEVVPPPPPRATVELQPLDTATEGPRAELAMMAIDPRELVAGLLDRWERTLEQRIYAEQRQRFEAELTNRQAKVKQLQLELTAVRAEHAAALAERERQLAERHRELSDLEREIHELRGQPRRAGWFRRR